MRRFWGGEKQTYEGLSAVLRPYTEKKGKDGTSVDKGKKRQDDSPSDSSEKIVKKKGKGKKKVNSSKKGSSSKSRHQ